MSRTARRRDTVPPAASAESARAQNQGSLIKKGTLVFLILIAAALGLYYWNARASRLTAQPVDNSHATIEQIVPAKEEEKSMTEETTEPSVPAPESTVLADVTVNGETIPVPESGGTIHKEVVDDDGSKTSVTMQFNSSSTGLSSQYSSSMLNVNVESSQTTESETE